MTQEQKDLLIADLCGRLPYGVKILHETWNYEWDQELSTLEKVTGIDERFIYTKVINDKGEEYTSDKHTISLFDDKPYLFPLSSMTDEQEEEFNNLFYRCNESAFIFNERFSYDRCSIKDIGFYPCYLQDWLIKNHFDYRGLIPMGLAIDATGLNIY